MIGRGMSARGGRVLAIFEAESAQSPMPLEGLFGQKRNPQGAALCFMLVWAGKQQLLQLYVSDPSP